MTGPEIFPPRTLDAQDRCCGRKPVFYRTRHPAGIQSDPHHFCPRCNAEFDTDGRQRANFAWLTADGGFTARYPDSDAVAYARAYFERQKGKTND